MRRGLLALAAAAALALPGAAGSDLNQGPQTVLAILATWGPQPVTQDAVRASLFTEADRFVRRASFGKAWLTGDVTPWLSLRQVSGCDDTSLSEINVGALNAARAAGYPVDQFSRFVFVTPRPAGCGNAGAGAANEIWLFGTASPRVLQHELGHTFGFGHAWSLACASCRPVEYGDPYDVMGHGPGDYNASEKAAAGWLTNAADAAPGNFTIDALEQPSTLLQALVVQTAHNVYWFDHREPLLADTALAGSPIVQGVEVHASPSPDDDGSSRYQPGNVLILNPTRKGRHAILPGESWGERGAFTLSVLAHTDTHVDVRFRWTDTVRPTQTPVYAPTGVVRTRRMDVAWGRARDDGSGVARYEVRVDGRLTGKLDSSAQRKLEVTRPKRRGRHTVTVVAVDRAGNRGKAGVTRFVVR